MKKTLRRILAVVICVVSAFCLMVNAFAAFNDRLVHYEGDSIYVWIDGTTYALEASMSKVNGSGNYTYEMEMIYVVSPNDYTRVYSAPGLNQSYFYKTFEKILVSSQAIYYANGTMLYSLYGR